MYYLFPHFLKTGFTKRNSRMCYNKNSDVMIETELQHRGKMIPEDKAVKAEDLNRAACRVLGIIREAAAHKKLSDLRKQEIR